MTSLPALQRPRPSEAHAESGEQGFLITLRASLLQGLVSWVGLGQLCDEHRCLDKASHMDHTASDKAGM